MVCSHDHALDEIKATYLTALTAIRDSVVAQQQSLQGQQDLLSQFLAAFRVEGGTGQPRIMDESAEVAAELLRMEEAGFPVNGSEAEKLRFMARHMEEMNG